MSYAFISSTYGVSIKVGDKVLHRPTQWFGKICRPNRKNCRVLVVKFFGDRSSKQLDPAEIEFARSSDAAKEA